MRKIAGIFRCCAVLAASIALLAVLGGCADRDVKVQPKGQVVIGGSVGG